MQTLEYLSRLRARPNKAFGIENLLERPRWGVEVEVFGVQSDVRRDSTREVAGVRRTRTRTRRPLQGRGWVVGSEEVHQ
jgi:hypothetical protein